MGVIFGLIILVCLLAGLFYYIRKVCMYLSPKARAERKLLKEKLSQEFTSCSACGGIYSKDKMRIYKIVDKEKDLGTYTKYISGGLGGSKTYRKTQVFTYAENVITIGIWHV